MVCYRSAYYKQIKKLPIIRLCHNAFPVVTTALLTMKVMVVMVEVVIEDMVALTTACPDTLCKT